MKVQNGDIYILSKEWNEEDNLLINRRPVLVVSQSDNFAKVVFLGVVFPHSKSEDRIIVEVRDNNRNLKTIISCKNTYNISFRYLEKKIGKSDQYTLSQITNMIDSIEQGKDKVVTLNSSWTIELVQDIKDIKNTLDKNQNSIDNNVAIIKEIQETTNSTKYMIKQRIIGLIIGIFIGIVSTICSQIII